MFFLDRIGNICRTPRACLKVMYLSNVTSERFDYSQTETVNVNNAQEIQYTIKYELPHENSYSRLWVLAASPYQEHCIMHDELYAHCTLRSSS